MVRKTRAENRHQKMLSIYGLWFLELVCHGYSSSEQNDEKRERTAIGCLQRLIKVIKVFLFEIVQRPPCVCSLDHNFKRVCLNAARQHINQSMKYWTSSQLPPVKLGRQSQVYCQNMLSSFCLMEHRRLIKQF